VTNDHVRKTTRGYVGNPPKFVGRDERCEIPDGKSLDQSTNHRSEAPIQFSRSGSASGDCAQNDEHFFATRNRGGKRLVRWSVGQVLLAGEEAQERAALMRDLIADGSA
jgi:hypothetical protein